MQHRKLGTTNLRLPVVSFGAWAIGGWMWGGTDDSEAVRAIQTGIDAGITCIDTAPAYGMGHSETIVGEAIAGRRDEVIVATKCGLRWDLEEGRKKMDSTDLEGNPISIYENLRPHSIRHECEQSLRRLNVDVIDLYQCHWPDPTSSLDDTMACLLDLKAKGKIRAIGVSNFSVEMIRQCQKHRAVDACQPMYNALERDVEATLLPYCAVQNIGVLAYSPIAQGLLTGKVTPDREFPEGDIRRNKPMFSQANREKVLAMLERVRPIADGHGITLGNLFIAWLLAQPGMTTALVGARNPDQAKENARAGDVRLSDDEVATIRAEVEALGDLTA